MPTRADWWRTAVIYQIYPRSFADSNGDGIGDLPGITARLDALAELGVDAIWLSPFYTSPQKDAGYDVADYTDVDPLFGTLADFDALRDRAHGLGTEADHRSRPESQFERASAGSRRRSPRRPDRRSARATCSATAAAQTATCRPNNWQSVFGGPAWTRVDRGRRHARPVVPAPVRHLAARLRLDQRARSRSCSASVLRFWLDRGVDGFRVDVAHGLAKKAGLPDWTPDPDAEHPASTSSSRRTGRSPACTRSTATGTGCSPSSGRIASWPARRGCSRSAEAGRLGAPGRDAADLQLHLPRDAVGGRAAQEGRRRLARRVRRSRRAQHLGALEPRRDPARHPARARPASAAGAGRRPEDALASRRRGRPAPSPRRHRVHARASRVRLPLPGRGARPARGHRPARQRPSGPDLLPHRRRELRARRMPRADPVDGGRSRRRASVPTRRELAAAARDLVGLRARLRSSASPDRRSSSTATALAARREHDLASNELVWQHDVDGHRAAPHVLAFRSGAVTVVANTGAAPVARPAGRVVLASGPIGADTLPGDTTVWVVD